MTSLSVLDLAPIIEGGDAGLALRNSLDLARHAESLGYRRFWLAEHHNMPGIASAATSVAIAHVAGGTKTIRVGAGGVMLPNHAPLVIAEQFGTLASLFPDRIDLGLGRAPGTDQQTARALRRTLESSPDNFPQDVLEILHYLGPQKPEDRILAVPGVGTEVPVWILGSSLFGASVAAALGLPYAFASHFAPKEMMAAISLYRAKFRPSGYLQKPYLMLGVNVFAAETIEQARFHMSSLELAFASLRRGRPGRLQPPKQNVRADFSPAETEMLDHALACSVIGDLQTVRDGFARLREKTAADEFICVSQMYDHAARLRSYQIAAEACELSRQNT